MSEVRKDIFTGANVIISELRGRRPANASKPVYGVMGKDDCPFCPGNEFMTPGWRENGEKRWLTRFFPNKYPALETKEDSGFGFHEVFVDTQSHEEELKDFSPVQVETALRALKARYDFYEACPGIKHVQIFKNKGALAGATQKHSHWQIIAGKFVPSAQETIAGNLSAYNKKAGGCLYCSMLEKELENGSRVIYENESFAVISPYASRFTYEAWIMPKNHFHAFSELSENDFAPLSDALLGVLRALDKIKNSADYNILLMDAPKTRLHSLFHWHIQILPRMGSLAGYEFSTGSHINHITPEKSAKEYRNYFHGGTNE